MGRRPSTRLVFTFEITKPRGVPNLVGKVAVGLDALDVRFMSLPGVEPVSKRKAHRVGAELVHDVKRVNHVASDLDILCPRSSGISPCRYTVLNGACAGELESEHDHARHPKEQDVVAVSITVVG